MKRSLSVISAAVSGVVLALTMGACEQHPFESTEYIEGTSKLYHHGEEHGNEEHSAHPEGEGPEGTKPHAEHKEGGAGDHAKPAEGEKKPH